MRSILFIVHLLLFLVALALVSLGQPVRCSLCSLIAAAVGWVPIFYLLSSYSSALKRFIVGTLWFTAVQLVQLSWLVSHPYLYIWFVYGGLALLLGLQFGLLALMVTRQQLAHLLSVLALAAIWTLFEWSRLFFLSGFSWNPAGLALTAALYPLQFASLLGVFGLSFWIIFTNLFALHVWFKRPSGQTSQRSFKYLCEIALWLVVAATPYLWGAGQVARQAPLIAAQLQTGKGLLHALLVQTAFPAEEALPWHSLEEFIAYTQGEWQTILNIVAPYLPGISQRPIDLIVLPEFTVPFGTYTPVYPAAEVFSAFAVLFSAQKPLSSFLPPLQPPWAEKTSEKGWKVNNAFWAQSLANVFHAPLVIGLEDVSSHENSAERQFYSSALFFAPQKSYEGQPTPSYLPSRYNKRVLVPMGEYIPLDFMRKLAQKYGVTASLTPGTAPEIFNITIDQHQPEHQQVVGLSPSICYEETFGHLTREGCLGGANMLVNLTSDVWYPHSLLPEQHLSHARLRTVENGVALIRACNTGVTCALDSLGRVHAVLSDAQGKSEWLQAALLASVPTHSYSTLYTLLGDKLIIAVCLLLTLIWLLWPAIARRSFQGVG